MIQGLDNHNGEESMRSIATSALLVIFWTSIGFAEAPGSGADSNWGQWRGPQANGVAPHGNPPIQWSESKNVRWKVELPGSGLAAPIVWGDRVYIQTVIKTDKKVEPAEKAESDDASPRSRRGRRSAPTNVHKFVIMALDRQTGKTVWSHTVREAVPHEAGHPDASQASGSPITDGKHLFAHFGSRGLYCFDMQGKLIWEKDFGLMTTRRGFGEGSSPVLHGDTIVVNWDHEGDSFIVALDKNTGAERWRKSRDEVTSWSTPLILQSDKASQVVVTATNSVRAYDLATGDVVWHCSGLGANCIPSPVADAGQIYAMSGYQKGALLAIRYPGAKGDVTDSAAIAWSINRGTPYVPSPALYGEVLYFLERSKAILSCYDTRTGKAHYTNQRLEGLTGVYASPVAAADRVYIVGRNGTTQVLKHGPKYQVLATNKLDDEFDSSPAIAGDELYLRGRTHLYCIAGK